MKHRDIERKLKRSNERWKRLRARGDDQDTTKQYTPEDVQSLLAKQGNGSGIIRPDAGELHLPANLDAIGEGEQTDSPYRVMFVIITLALIFIAIVTYFVARMPNKD
jgi:hypothetical protein